jgi:hypothetical protein
MHSWKTRRRGVLRWLGRIAVAVILLAGLSTGLVLWRLSRGPVSLGWLTPRLDRALTGLAAPNSVRCSDVIVTWNAWRDPLDLRATGVSMTAADGREVAHFSELEIDLHLPSLIIGRVMPEAVTLTGLELTAVRDTGGSFSLGFAGGQTTGDGSKLDGTAWLDSWLDPKTPGPLRLLQRVRITDTSLVMADTTLDRTWGADGLDLEVERTATGLDASLSMTLELADTKAPLSATASFARADKRLDAHLALTGFTPAALAGIAPVIEPLREISLTADASLDVVVGPGWDIEVTAFSVSTAAGSLAGKIDAPEPKTRITGTLELRDLQPSVLAAAVPPLSLLGGVRVVVNGRGAFELDALDHLRVPTLELGISDGSAGASTSRATDDEPVADELGSLSAHDIEADLRAGDVSGKITASNLDPSLLAGHIDLLRPAAGLRFPIDATIKATIEAREPRTVDFNLRAGSGSVAIPAPVGRTWPLAGATVDGHLEGLETLTIDRASLDLGGGTVVGVTSKVNLAGRAVTVAARAEIAALTLERVDELWPGEIAAGVGEWIADHIPTGSVKDIHAEVELGTTGAGLELHRLTGGFAYSGLRLSLFPQAAPIEGIDGTASFTEAGFTFSPTGAELDDLRVTGGTVVISGLDHAPTLLAVDATVEGPVDTALAFVNGDPLALVDPSIIDAKDVSGTATTRIQLELPLDGPSSGEVQSFDVASKISDLAWSRPIIGPPTSDGELTVHVTPLELTINGATKSGQAPLTIDLDEFFSGGDLLRRVVVRGDVDRAGLESLGVPTFGFLEDTVGVAVTYTADRAGGSRIDGAVDLEAAKIDVPEIAWHKPPGVPGRLTATANTETGQGWTIDPVGLTADDLDVAASLELAGSPPAVKSIDLARFHHGRSDFSGSANARPTGGFEIRIKGASFDVEPLVSGIAQRAPADEQHGGTGSRIPAFDLHVELDRIVGRSEMALSNVVVDAAFDGERLQRGEVSAAIGAAGSLSVDTAISSGLRTTKIGVVGVGAVLSLLHVAPYFDGGTLTLEGDEVAVGDPVTAHLVMKNLKITKSPVFAQLLRLASMQGMLATFTGQGLKVNQLQADLSYQDRLLTFSELNVLADGVGITGNGSIDIGRRTVDCNGYLAPAAAIQRIVGKIPLLGRILTGIHREGLIATAFSISGPLKGPTVKAKPLSTLTPGIIRDFTRLKPEKKTTQ